MTAVRKAAAARKLDLRRRGSDEVMSPRPTTGDHKTIVRTATVEAIVKNNALLSELAKV